MAGIAPAGEDGHDASRPGETTITRLMPSKAGADLPDAEPRWTGLRQFVGLAVPLLTAAAVLATACLGYAQSEPPDLIKARAKERRTFTDAEIIKGFFHTAFGAEFRVAGSTDRIRKYDGPVRVFADSKASPDRRAELAMVVDDIREHVQHLDIAMADKPEDAQVNVTLIRDRDLRRTIRKFWSEHARKIQRLEPQCLSGFQKDDTFKIVRSDVLLVVDAGDFIFRDCAYEELLQSLGPINDTDIPWTMFNDDVQMGFFDIYDQYILNILYHPRIKPGMTVDEVSGLLPQIIPKVRAFVERTNSTAP